MIRQTESRLRRRAIRKTLGALLILSAAWVLTPASLQAENQDWCEGFCAGFCYFNGGCASADWTGECTFSCNG